MRTKVKIKLKDMDLPTYEVRYDAVHASAIEYGSDPHWPPYEDILKWCRRKLGLTGKNATDAAAAIQNSIGKKGTEPQPFLRPAIDEAEGRRWESIEEVAEFVFNRSQDIILEKGITDTGTLLKSGTWQEV